MTALLTASRAKCARSCRRRHHLQYGLGLRPVATAEALRFGTLVHLGLEAWWLAKKAGLPQEEWLTRALAAAVGAADEYEAARVQVALVGYHLRWQGEAYEVLAVEVQFEAPLRNPATGAASRTWQLAGKLDVVVRDAGGRVLLVEHKTSSEDVSPGSPYWLRLRMDGQVSVYFDGAAALGYDVAGCLYDVLAKPALRPSQVALVDDAGVKVVLDAEGHRVRTKDGKKWRETGDGAQGFVLQTRTETPAEYRERLTAAVTEDVGRYYARGEVVRLEAELDEARYDVWQLGVQLREDEAARRYPRNPDACVQYGRTCPYFGVCTGTESADDAALFTRSTDVHPELSGAAAHPQSESKEETPCPPSP